MRPASPLYVVGAGSAHPSIELTSAELEERLPDLEPGWSERYLGMTSRRVLPPHGQATDLTIAAATAAMEKEGWSADSVDLIVGAAAFPDQVMPASAAFVGKACAPTAFAFDVNAACASGLTGIAAATGLFATEPRFERAIVCTGDHSSAWADYRDPRSCIFFGDAGAALLLANEPGTNGSFQVRGIELEGDSEFPEKVFTPRRGYFRSDGRYSFKQVIRLAGLVVDRLLGSHDVATSDLRAVAIHQASSRVHESIAEALGIESNRFWHNYEWAGNQSASGIMTSFSEGWAANRDSLSNGDLVLLAAVGGGYAAGAVLLEWIA